MNDNIYRAYEGDDLLGKYDTEDEAQSAIEEAKEDAGSVAARRQYRVECRQRLGGEIAG